MITLHMSPLSPYARKVRLLLIDKGLQWERIDTETTDPPPEFIAKNPNLRIPVISDDQTGLTLFESNMILDYLLTTYPDNPPQAPQPPLAAVMVRPDHRWADLQLLSTIETALNSGINLLLMERSGIKAEQAVFLQKEQRRIQTNLDWLEAKATPEGYAPGVFSIQDLNLMCTLQWFDFREVCEWRGRPNLEAIVARYTGRPSVRETAPA